MADGWERRGAVEQGTPLHKQTVWDHTDITCGVGSCTDVEEYCRTVTYCDGGLYGELAVSEL